MNASSGFLIAGIALMLLILALTSAVDAALTAIGRHRLNAMQEENASRAARISRLLNDPYRFKAAILLINAACTIRATALVMAAADALAIGWQIAGLLLLLLLIMIFGEALPKAMAVRDTAAAARLLTGPMALVVEVIWPVAWGVGVISRPLIHLTGGRAAAATPLVTEEELRMLVNVGEEEGLIEPGEREMIEGIFTFGDTAVREVMTPRVDIVALEETAGIDEALDAVIARGHSRIPVYRDTIDHIIGILYAKDLLPWMRANKTDVALGSLLRSAHFVPETIKVDALLRDLQARKVHMAIVVDEYGGVAGLVTIEDVIEEIVGEIQDEYDFEGPEIQVVGEGELIVDARVLIDDLNELIGLQLSSAESDRIGGVVFEYLGRVPKIGDEIQPAEGVTIAVLAVEGLRPRKLRIRFRTESALTYRATEEQTANDRTS
ncbi:MAG TPA: hemolysin family protein [Roseiflexaceae bacterium]|nr:hemolysin family protein [Roseiflexaceae bacterium]